VIGPSSISPNITTTVSLPSATSWSYSGYTLLFALENVLLTVTLRSCFAILQLG
jgi:hypothetical protein